MSAQSDITSETSSSMSFFERYLTAWVEICIVVGI